MNSKKCMQYLLVTADGKIRMFFVKEVAMMYCVLFGGTVTTRFVD